MAYIGTGTEQDPYLVSTLADLRECAGISGAYVKVISNIDASLEENQTFHDVSCTKIYADAITELSNITYIGQYLFHLHSTVEIRNIYFKNVIFSPTGTETSNSLLFSDVGIATFYQCKLSVQGNIGNKPLALAKVSSHGGLVFDKCAVFADFERTGCSTYSFGAIVEWGQSFSWCSFTECTLLLNGFGGSYQYAPTFEAVCTYCAMKISANIGSDGTESNKGYIFRSGSHHNVLVLSMNRPAYVNVVGLTVADAENATNVSYSGTELYQLTEQQIKSENYLRSINFIP